MLKYANELKHLSKDPLFQFGHRAKGHHVTKGMYRCMAIQCLSLQTEQRIGLVSRYLLHVSKNLSDHRKLI